MIDARCTHLDDCRLLRKANLIKIWFCDMSDCNGEVDNSGAPGEKVIRTHAKQRQVNTVRLITLIELDGIFISVHCVCCAHTVDQNDVYANRLDNKVRRLPVRSATDSGSHGSRLQHISARAESCFYVTQVYSI
nr:hypothetical protein CFP56_02551 [Quercus suber]